MPRLNAYFSGAVFLFFSALMGCGIEGNPRAGYLVGCCNYVSTGFCLNDFYVRRIERFSIRDFVLTSLYDNDDNFMFSIYEGSHPQVDEGDVGEITERNGLKVKKFKGDPEQVLVSIDDGNYPSQIHFKNFSIDEQSSINSSNVDRWIYFRTEPEYQQSPQCKYDLSVYK